ncbi:MAG: hypothetical protein IJO28_04210 [Oscillospiraceae bacterium]|nr:hypothetical protein [Oscillospiraceae bacterium]
MKKLRVMVMALSLCTMLFGCSAKGPWQSLTYHVTSSVMTEGCHFYLSRDDGMLSGYCYDGEVEYRQDEAKQIPAETVEAIVAMELENASTARGKLFGVLDGTEVTVTLGYPDGSERKISLSAEQQAQIFRLLQKELVGK